MIIKVGTLVLCHLIISGTAPQNNAEGPKIEKIPGIVKEITEGEDIEMMNNDYAVKKVKYMLLVEPQEKDKIFKVNANACRPVIDEETHIRLTKEKMKKDAKSNKNNELKNNSKESVKSNKEEKAPANSVDPDKEKLLKELE
jgi:hypothetical protein